MEKFNQNGEQNNNRIVQALLTLRNTHDPVQGANYPCTDLLGTKFKGLITLHQKKCCGLL